MANRMAVAFALGGIITAGYFQEPARAQDRCGTRRPLALLDSLIHAHGQSRVIGAITGGDVEYWHP